MVRDRFFQRMGSLLPDRSSGIYWQLLLPTFWGGLDLWTDQDLLDMYKKVPEPSKTTMESYISKCPVDSKDIEYLRKFLTNYSYRGFRLDEAEVQAMKSHLTVMMNYLPFDSWWNLRKQFDPEGTMSATSLTERLAAEGWREENAILDELLRPILFLTIQNLVVEEYAMRIFLGRNFGTSFYESPKWRTYHIGGDDHLAIGPSSYLKEITNCHIRMGSKISDGKHGTSRLAVMYCEKVLDIRNIYKPFSVCRINDSTETYENSPFVDSVKLRLLSPTTKSFDVVADRNVAIGKGLSLGRCLRWLNKDPL
uniref:Uncharacterized protein n=1 Tax=Moriarty virus TaxID=2600342 RepID=A0A5B8X9Z7_9VIRU|nr:hypothetical protein 2 [Moriarty virus]